MIFGNKVRYLAWILFLIISSGTVFAYFEQKWQEATNLLGGVEVISNGDNPNNGITYHPDTKKWTCNSTNTVKSTSKDVTGNIQTGCKWQCVELAQRYYYLTPKFDYHVGHSAMWDVDYAYQMFDRVKDNSFTPPYNDLHAYENDRTKNPPLPIVGDLIIFSKKGDQNGASGHVAVVGKSQDGIFTIAEQNMDERGQGLRTLKINPNVKEAEIIIPDKGTPVRGWIRSPKNPNIPKPNEMILSQNRIMQTKIISSSTTCNGDFSLLVPSNKLLVENYPSNVGKTVTIGEFTKGTELAFIIDTRKSSCNNLRSTNHPEFARITKLEEDHWKIEWEDQDSGGNGDFDDLVVEIFPTNQNPIPTSTLKPTPIQTPTLSITPPQSNIGMKRVDELILPAKDIQIEFQSHQIASGIVDDLNGFLYFGTFHNIPPYDTAKGIGYIEKIDLNTFSPIGKITLDLPKEYPSEYKLYAAAIDTKHGFAYFAPYTWTAWTGGHPKIIKIDLKAFTRYATLELPPSDQFIGGAAIDPKNEFVYFTNYDRIIKVDLNTFTRVGDLLLTGNKSSNILFDNFGFAYFQVEGKITKVDLNTFSIVDSFTLKDENGKDTPANICAISPKSNIGYAIYRPQESLYRFTEINLSTFSQGKYLDSDSTLEDRFFRNCYLDEAKGFAYITGGSNIGPYLSERIIKVNLNNFTRVDTFTLSPSEWLYVTTGSVIDPRNGYFYFSNVSSHEITPEGRKVRIGKILKISL